MLATPPHYSIEHIVTQAIHEDLGSGDLSAQLISAQQQIQAAIIARQDLILCGQAYAEMTFKQISPEIVVDWSLRDGAQVQAEQSLCTIQGPARAILTAERTALNFLQLLSGTATKTAQYVQAIAHTKAQVLDTRKTLPGLRAAQKYAVQCGGGLNHRQGLYDAILLKENHLHAASSSADLIAQALTAADGKPVILEVESLAQLETALAYPLTRIMLDNFSVSDLQKAVATSQGQLPLEASGGITLANIRAVAETGVDYISLGTITKDVQAADLSLLFHAS